MAKMKTEDGFVVQVGREGGEYRLRVSDDDELVFTPKDWDKFKRLVKEEES